MCFSVALFSDACNETQNFLRDKSTFQTLKLYTVLTMCSHENDNSQSEQQTNHFSGSYLVSKLNSSCYTENVQPRQIYA